MPVKRFGLIGTPISHSLSPLLFKAAYPGSDMSYELIEAGTIDESFDIFLRGFDAVNVTSPFKEDALLKADAASPAASRAGATNLLIKQDGRIIAHNTDYSAVKSILSSLVRPSCPSSVLVIGCGGAGKAATLAANDLNCKTFVANRNFGKAQEFCSRTNRTVPIAMEEIREIIHLQDIVIYTLPVPPEDISNAVFIGKTVIEANYKAPSLSFLSNSGGATTYISGKEWLTRQAIDGFTIMTGIKPDIERIRASAQKF